MEEYKEIQGAYKWRTFQLEEKPEVIHIKQIREEEYMLVHEDAYDIRTGKVEFFFSKKELELTYNLEL
jgi:hypothetical protein